MFNGGVLLEREPQLTVLGSLLAQAAAGEGRLVLLAGEAGVGKTALVAELVRTLPGPGVDRMRVRRGACDDLTTPAPLGPVIEALPELEEVADGAAPRHTLLRTARTVLGEEPTLLVLEDVHWADEATLELLRYLGRRLDGLPLLVVATYRDEVAADHPLRLLLGDLAAPGLVRLTVPPLSPSAVRQLVASSGSGVDAGALHAVTGGNAFYVTEVLAHPGHGGPPATVRDAVLARVARLPTDAKEVLATAAVLGQPATLGQLAQVSGRPPRAVDECVAAGLLVARGSGWDFRHALARLAVASTLAPARAAELHQAAYAVLTAAGVADDRRLAFHAAAWGDDAAVDRHAPRAAARAARLGAHREAVELYRLALGAHPQRDPQRAGLWADLSYECYLTGRLEEARDARLEALELSTSPEDTGATLRWLSRLSWFLARKRDAESYAERAVATLEPLGPGAELAMAYSNVAQLRMLEGDVAEAVAWGGRALELARALGLRETESHALNNIGAALAQRGDAQEGLSRLHRALDLALAADAHEHAARAFTNLAASLVVLRRLPEADVQLRAGLDYCAERDLDAWQHYMSAWRAVSLAEQGRYAEARTVTTGLLGQGQVAAVARIPALAVAARLELRAADPDGRAEALLAEAVSLAHGSGESQRLVPVACTVAEAAWLRGTPDEVPAVVHEAWEAALARPQSWEVGELAWWRTVLGLRPAADVELAEPFRLMVGGRWHAAAEAWHSLGCPLWEALSLAHAPDLASAHRAAELLGGLPAPAVHRAVVRDRRRAGLPVPRGPREPSRANDAGLTARELEVLGLLADGLSDADIARALVLSRKTVGHHVSAVLTKLGEPSRSRAAAAAQRRGLVTTDDVG